MKTILSTILLLTGSAFAGLTEVSSPQIMFGKYAVAVTNVCKTVDAYGDVTLFGGIGAKCVKYKWQSDSPRRKCVKSVPVELTRSATYTKKKCGHALSGRQRRGSEYDFDQICRDVVYKTYTYDKSYVINTYKWSSRNAKRENDKSRRKLVDSYSFIIPPCN